MESTTGEEVTKKFNDDTIDNVAVDEVIRNIFDKDPIISEKGICALERLLSCGWSDENERFFQQRMTEFFEDICSDDDPVNAGSHDPRAHEEYKIFVATADPESLKREYSCLKACVRYLSYQERKNNMISDEACTAGYQKLCNILLSYLLERFLPCCDSSRYSKLGAEVFGKVCVLQGFPASSVHAKEILKVINHELQQDASNVILDGNELENEKTDSENMSVPPVLQKPKSSMVEGALEFLLVFGSNFRRDLKCLIDNNLLNTLCSCLNHQNRFVRASSFSLATLVVEIASLDPEYYSLMERMAIDIAQGLSDLCPQVRLNAALCARKLAQNMCDLSHGDKNEHSCNSICLTLLPALCLSRYYSADSKYLMFCQESWRELTQGSGAQLVETHINQVVKYYIESTKNHNSVIRESSCACIAELSRKIDKDLLLPYVPTLLTALEACFSDSSWRVKDAACLASGNFIENYAEESKSKSHDFLEFFLLNLGSSHMILRQGASASICHLIRSYKEEILQLVMPKIKLCFESMRTKSRTGAGSQLEVKGAQSPHSSPWEFCDGCIFLLGDVSKIAGCGSVVEGMLLPMSEAIRGRDYPEHVVVLETACKTVPILAKSIGKQIFKQYLSEFFEHIFYSLGSFDESLSIAAKNCLGELSSIYGPNILRLRVEMCNPSFLQMMEKAEI